MPFAEINGANIYYELAGAGDPLVFIHAGIADSRMWDDQFEKFAQHYRVLRYDLRGFGQTDAKPMPFTHHEDLAALLTALGIERTALIGCSNGGRAAMNFALDYPDRATALVMVCSSPGGFKFDSEAPALWPEIVKAYDSGDWELTAKLEAQLWAVGPYRQPEQVDAQIRNLVAEMDLIALKKESAIKQEQSMSPPAIERLGELHIPVLAVVGDVDSPVTLAAGTFIEQQIAGARQVMMRNTAHLPSMEHPDEFNRIVLDFLEAALSG
ncbi:MAG: alpha/beta fold hydrolase [Chloroflexota bacterium]